MSTELTEPNFWDFQGGFYQPLSTTGWGESRVVGAAAVAAGAVAALTARRKGRPMGEDVREDRT